MFAKENLELSKFKGSQMKTCVLGKKVWKDAKSQEFSNPLIIFNHPLHFLRIQNLPRLPSLNGTTATLKPASSKESPHHWSCLQHRVVSNFVSMVDEIPKPESRGLVVVVVVVVVVVMGDLPYFSPTFGGIPSASLGRKKFPTDDQCMLKKPGACWVWPIWPLPNMDRLRNGSLVKMLKLP